VCKEPVTLFEITRRTCDAHSGYPVNHTKR
jgi:hypothetical protein